jgi:4-hydroxy-tetrahydrodipicolinate synthase
MRTLEGICPILATTFNEDASLDLASQARLVDHLLESGAHGLGLFGNAGEGYTLTEDERRRILDLVVKRVNDRVALVVNCGHTGTDAAVRLSKEAEDRGAAVLMVPPPYYMKAEGDGLLRHYEAIGRAVRVPIMVQDAPAMTQVAMPAALLARLSREIEAVRYVKVEAPPTAPKITAVLRESEGQLTPFGGLNGQFLIEEVQRGARGTMPGSDMTELFLRIWEGLKAGHTSDAWEVFTSALPLVRFELQPGLGVSAMKHNLTWAGVIRCARVRQPTADLTAESLRELQFLRKWVGDRTSSVKAAAM